MPLVSDDDTTRWWRNATIMVPAAVAILVAIIGLVGVLISTGGSDSTPPPSIQEQPSGQITSPASGERVTRQIDARGTLVNIPEDQHVWLVVRDGNLLYPQGSPLESADGKWSLSFNQAGASTVISLELYLMTDEGHQLLSDRLREKEFGGIPRIPGATRLDVADNVQIGS
jgi:hypothetical protein